MVRMNTRQASPLGNNAAPQFSICAAAAAATAAPLVLPLPAAHPRPLSFHDDRYDCEVVQRGGALFMRFDGYGTEDDEPLRELSALRFSSGAAEPADCPTLVPGTRVTGFKCSPAADLWIDAEIVGKKAGRHDGGKCTCRWAWGGRHPAGARFWHRPGQGKPGCCVCAAASPWTCREKQA